MTGYTRPLLAAEELEAEIDALRSASASEVIVEANATSRVLLTEWLSTCIAGDTLLVSSLDRLSPQVTQLVRALLEFREHGVHLRCMDGSEVDVTSDGAVAALQTLDRVHRRQRSRRTREGVVGKASGRPRVLTSDQVEMAVELRRAGRSLAHIALVLGVSTTTVQRVFSSGR